MMLHEIKAGRLAKNRSRKRIGRGESSGWGKSAGRGDKGQDSRAGSKRTATNEGGSIPSFRRIPKRGFSNAQFTKRYTVINVGRLAEKFDAGASIDPAVLSATGLIEDAKARVKVLASGKVEKALTVKAHKFSQAAEEAIKAAGGSVEVIS